MTSLNCAACNGDCKETEEASLCCSAGGKSYYEPANGVCYNC